jgi:hypothetical protein
VTDLPAGSVKIMAGCDGYISKDLGATPISGIRQAQDVAPHADQPFSISMEPTGDARVLVQTPDGKPLAGAIVGFCPNQSFASGTNIVGTRADSSKMLQSRDQGFDALARSGPEVPRFSATTDATGEAVIKGLPPGDQIFFVSAENYEMRIQANAPYPRRMTTITVKSSTEVFAKVKLEPKGSMSLSAAMQTISR